MKKKDINDLLSTAREEEQNREEWRLRLALLKESKAYRDFWDEYGGDKVRQANEQIQDFYSRHDCTRGMTEEAANAFFSECEEASNTSTMFNGPLREQFGIDISGFLPLFRRQEWLDRLDPYKQNDQAIVRFHYPLPAISQVDDGPCQDKPAEHHFRTPYPLKERGNGLKPSERLLRVDLSRKRSELIEEFKLFLDLVEAHRTGGDVPEAWKLNYATWNPDNSRFRSEAWQALEVYRLRRKITPYKDIAQTLGIGLQAAKMAYKRAHILIENKPPVPRKKLPISLADVKGGCANCPLRATCTELCPDMLRYVGQDYSGQIETTTSALDLFEIKQKRSYIKPT